MCLIYPKFGIGGKKSGRALDVGSQRLQPKIKCFLVKCLLVVFKNNHSAEFFQLILDLYLLKKDQLFTDKTYETRV